MNSPAIRQSAELTFRQDVVEGLTAAQKRLPSKYFYDLRGSRLFDEITRLDEYYLTRTEASIMERCAEQIARQLGSQVMLLEFGSGSSVKTRVLLDRLDDPVAYVPIDISEDHLLKTAAELRRDYPHIEILPVVADFTKSITLPVPRRTPDHRAVYFPGSTIGNLKPDAASALLERMGNMLGDAGGILIGIDLQKDVRVLEAAYNDAKGVTAEFNLNLLHRINAELDGNFDIGQFRHEAVYNHEAHRIEMYIVSQREQAVTIDGQPIRFLAGERILTEYSHKYTVDGFAKLAAAAGGFALHACWTDEERLFAVLHLVRELP